MKVLTYVTKYGHIFNKPFAKVSEQQQDMDFDAMAYRMYEALKPEASFEEFSMGLKEEMEHDDVTGGDLGKTAAIALAHLKEDANYYTKLKAAMAKGGPGSGRYPEGSGKEDKDGGGKPEKSGNENIDRNFPDLGPRGVPFKVGEGVEVVLDRGKGMYSTEKGKVTENTGVGVVRVEHPPSFLYGGKSRIEVYGEGVIRRLKSSE